MNSQALRDKGGEHSSDHMQKHQGVCIPRCPGETESSVGVAGHPARWSVANVPKNQPSSLRLQAEPQKTGEPETNDGKTETATRPKDEVINPPTPKTQSLCSFYDHHVCIPVIFKCREHLGCGMEKVTSFSQLNPPITKFPKHIQNTKIVQCTLGYTLMIQIQFLTVECFNAMFQANIKEAIYHGSKRESEKALPEDISAFREPRVTDKWKKGGNREKPGGFVSIIRECSNVY